MIALLLAFAALGASADAPAPATYVWPLERAPVLTSSFGEYRSGRLHAGIDLRTGGIGLPVHAAADGYVARVRCSPYGYGKGIYLHLDDGHTVVYGHLDSINGALGDYVRGAQHAAKDYTVDLTPEAGQFRVRRGEVIALSGQSGTEAPHLHFEWRERGDELVNPWLLGVRWPDTARPVIRRVALIPLEPNASVAHGAAPLIVTLHKAGEDRYEADPIDVSGSIAAAVDLVDPVEGARLGVYRTVVRVDGQEVFRVQYDRLSYAHLDDGAVAYHPFLDGEFLNLFRWPNCTLESYAQNKGDGSFNVGAKGAQLEVEATDENGNSATAIIPLWYAAGVKEQPKSDTAGQGTINLLCSGAMLTLSAEFSAPEAEAPIAIVTGGDHAERTPMPRVAANRFALNLAPEKSGQYAIAAEHPRAPRFEQTVHVFQRGLKSAPFAFEGVRLEVPSGAPYGTLYTRISRAETAPKAMIPTRGPAYHVWPDRSPLAVPVRLVLPLPAQQGNKTKDASAGPKPLQRLGVYRWTGKSWLPLETTRTPEGLSVQTRAFGLFCVLEDTRAPEFRDIKPVNGETSGARPEIAAAVRDEGSGIERVEILCDGHWLLTAHDPQRGRCFWERDEDLAPGAHTLTFRATDHAGNTTEVTRSLQVSL